MARKLPTMPVPDKIRPSSKPGGAVICTCCGGAYTKPSDFLVAPHTPLYRYNGGRMPVCRGCVESLFNEYVERYGDHEAIRRICMRFDVYFSPSIAEASKNQRNYKSRIVAYLALVNLSAHAGKTYDTTIEEEAATAITSDQDMNVAEQDKSFVVTKQMTHDWGPNYSAADYEYLETEYQDWCTKCVIKGKAQKALVRDLCLIELQKNRELFDGRIDVYTKLCDTYRKTLDGAELTPKIEAANDKASEIPLGVMIKNFEDHDPIPEPLEEWKDVDGVIRVVSIYFLGHLMKMLGIKNRYSKMYEEEMAKYRVEMPELSGADDEDVFESIINRAAHAETVGGADAID